MKKWLKMTGVLVAAGIMQTGCVYTHVRAPLDQNFDKTELGTKKGRADIHTVMWLAAWGDGGTQAAAEDGGLTVIRHADSELRLFLFGAYTRLTTIVYGD
ncbi:MAG: TRL domain-containing protein [Lentisphaeria bacterium]|nr:TRL domain-containing protein [Lentisphaeria bacterium]